ncbi:MAG: Ig-like domain-containing protein, partial [Pseudomonadota bacterium]|nr:Ig-like domain-containing protein [Pseudomonadota bacterium]
MDMKHILLQVNDINTTVARFQIEGGNGGVGMRGKPVKVLAKANVKYQLTDEATGFGPENIATKRVGKDLHIAFEGGAVEQPDLIIENYYTDGGLGYSDGTSNLVIGQHETGAYYSYIPESAQASDAISMLLDGVKAGQVLGGESMLAALWLPAAALGALSPGVAAAALGAIAVGAAGAGGGSGKPGPKPVADTTAPVAPTVEVAQDGMTITGKAEPGSTVKIDLNGDGKPDLVVVADAKGNYAATAPTPLTTGTKVVVTATDAAGNESLPGTGVFLDTTAPVAPGFTVIDDVSGIVGPITAGGSTNDSQPTFSGGGATPGDTIKVYDNGVPIGTAVVDAGGNWSITPTTPLKDGGHSITVTASDPAGNESAPSAPLVFTSDTNAPAAPTVIVALDGSSISGKAEPGSTVEVDVNGDGRPDYSAVVDPNGNYTIDTSAAPLVGGELVTAVAIDNSGNQSGPSTTQAPNSVSLTVSYDPATNTVSGSGATPGETVSIDLNGDGVADATTTAQPDGSYSVVPSTKPVDGATITADAPGETQASTGPVEMPLTVSYDPATNTVSGSGAT